MSRFGASHGYFNYQKTSARVLTYTDKKKRGWLSELFPQGIVHQEKPNELMAAGVLSQPVLMEAATSIEPDFDERDYVDWISSYLRQCINFYYRCSAVENVDIGSRGDRFRRWKIWLYQGNDPAWVQPHVDSLAAAIRAAREKAGYQAAPNSIEVVD